MESNKLRVRRPILEIQELYEKGDKKPLEDLMRAVKGIKELPHDDPNSFFNIAGYHGLPYREVSEEKREKDVTYWGGYCHHGEILFPLWHRIYVKRFEEALQSIVPNITMPYWETCNPKSYQEGLPWVFTAKDFMLDGKLIPNPLRSYKFPMDVNDSIQEMQDPNNNSKPKDYETVRYPLSGVVGTEESRKFTEEHNAKYQDYDENVRLLNENIKHWLDPNYVQSISKEFAQCIHAPNYTVFSNISSENEWNGSNPTAKSLEAPHNAVHMAIGGYTAPGYTGNDPGKGSVEGASGDMGENDTAAFDPFFHFLHCDIDRMFWIWQKKHNQIKTLDIISDYKGTQSKDNYGGVTPGYSSTQKLDLDSPLYPFMKVDSNGNKVPYTPKDILDIESQLGITYSKGSLDDIVLKTAKLFSISQVEAPVAKLEVFNVDKTKINGSFLVEASLKTREGVVLLGSKSVINRWSPKTCKNCQSFSEMKFIFDIPSDIKDLSKVEPMVAIRRHGAPCQKKTSMFDDMERNIKTRFINTLTEPNLNYI